MAKAESTIVPSVREGAKEPTELSEVKFRVRQIAQKCSQAFALLEIVARNGTYDAAATGEGWKAREEGFSVHHSTVINIIDVVQEIVQEIEEQNFEVMSMVEADANRVVTRLLTRRQLGG